MVWWLLDVEAGTKEQAFDFTDQTPWPGATSFWTKGEGTLSADGKVLGLMATSYDAAAQRNTCHGLLALDSVYFPRYIFIKSIVNRKSPISL